MMSRIEPQADPNTLSTHDLSRILQVSRATLSRWIALGCPFQKEKQSRKHVFNLGHVENWLAQEGKAKTSRGFPSRRQLKQYWIFDWEGRFEEVVSGSQNAYKALIYSGRDESYKARACAVDATGNEYIAYGGKLRQYNPCTHKDDIEWDESDIEDPGDEEHSLHSRP